MIMNINTHELRTQYPIKFLFPPPRLRGGGRGWGSIFSRDKKNNFDIFMIYQTKNPLQQYYSGYLIFQSGVNSKIGIKKATLKQHLLCYWYFSMVFHAQNSCESIAFVHRQQPQPRQDNQLHHPGRTSGKTHFEKMTIKTLIPSSRSLFKTIQRFNNF